MIVGAVRERKPEEYRVALTPAGAAELAAAGHRVLVERGAGRGSAFPDEAYAAAGAELADGTDVWSRAELLLKVKEPLPEEWPRLRPGQVLFTYLHLAAAPELAAALVASGATCVAYETVQDDAGRLPLLAPMSEVAGRLAPQMAANALGRASGGRGVLLAGVPGVPPAKVAVLGGGMVGANAAVIALGMGADVWVLDRSVDRLRALEERLDGRARLVVANRTTVAEAVRDADAVIGAVLVAGARAPKLVDREGLAAMRAGAVVVDVSIDQGGCFETSRPTTHAEPTYVVDGVVHYCVSNMPGVVPLTATMGLTNATLPYVELIAELGLEEAIEASPALARGVNVHRGRITNRPVAESLGAEYAPLSRAA
jgi:alanine dehydrogenase